MVSSRVLGNAEEQKIFNPKSSLNDSVFVKLNLMGQAVWIYAKETSWVDRLGGHYKDLLV